METIAGDSTWGGVGTVPARAVLDAIVDQVPMGILAVEAGSGDVIVANDAARHMVGGLRRVEGLADDEHGWPLLRTLAFGEAFDHEHVQVVKDDGSSVFIELSSRPVYGDDGEILAAVVVFQDVSARDRQDRVASDFVVNAAHQLQSPLAAIISSVEVLQAGAKDRPERDQFLTHLEREAARLARLTTALLTLARAEGTTESQRELVELEPMLHRIAGDAARSALAAVSVECDPALALIANADLLEHALAGVVDNAVKNTSHGTISIAGRRVGDDVVISIADTGSGIPEDEQSRVFERFYRVGSTKGFGLGLAIVNAAVRALGGQIDLESAPGKGTTVAITLPQPAAVDP